jgi:hypothetical protein
MPVVRGGGPARPGGRHPHAAAGSQAAGGREMTNF